MPVYYAEIGLPVTKLAGNAVEYFTLKHATVTIIFTCSTGRRSIALNYGFLQDFSKTENTDVSYYCSKVW